MPHILKNTFIELVIDLPLEHYNFSRFDWTGKIRSVKYKGKEITGIERTDNVNEHHIGKGFYNEFGIDSPIGFEEAKIGDWFHKIGVGLLKKESHQYDFCKLHEILPATFSTKIYDNKVVLICKSALKNGYAYELVKEILIVDNKFLINYKLQNTGDKIFMTNEYVHNFMAIDNEVMGENYEVTFSFDLQPTLFEESVNPENTVVIGMNSATFKSTPHDPFFFSNLTGNAMVNASWELKNKSKKIKVGETVNFLTDKVNLWGWTHVISPEIFIKINLNPGESVEWLRTFEINQY